MWLHFSWKMAFDEEFSHYSPGVQIMIQATWHMKSLKSFKRADSLATADHNLMDHIWRERENIGTILIGLGRLKSGSTTKAARSLDRNNQIREGIKSLVKRFR